MTDQMMKLYSHITPSLSPGHYVAEVSQDIVDDPASTDSSLPPPQSLGGLPDRELHFDVTGPRFAMAGTEVFGVFPPPNSSGPFAARLAQIVLKRRTLPWERTGLLPWLALVVLAETEATFLSNLRADFAYTPGSVPSGIPSGATANCIEVSQTVVDRTFPAESELALLAHAREVDTSSSEYADDDGFVSVVLSNRLPLPGLKYGAYLISLEGQHAVLPQPGPTADQVDLTFAYADLYTTPDEVPRLVASGREGPTRTVDTFDPAGVVGPLDGGGFLVDGDGLAVDRATAPPREAGAARSTVGISQGFVRHDVDFRAIEQSAGRPPEQKFRFPVLAYWNFECSEVAGDFRGYMSNLEVGLMGTATPPADDPRAPIPVTAPTGHLEVDHVDRRGRSAKSWYRGPFAPSKVTRQSANRVFHIAEQATKVVAERRLDISQSAAFEIGRLLAMSDTQFVRDIRAWVRQRHNDKWMDHIVVPEHKRFGSDLGEAVDLDRLLVIRSLIPEGIGGNPLTELGAIRPRHEAEELIDDGDIEVIATGLGLSTALVKDALGDGLTSQPIGGPVTGRTTRSFDQVLRAGPDTGVTTKLGNEVGIRTAFVKAFERQVSGPVDPAVVGQIISGEIDLGGASGRFGPFADLADRLPENGTESGAEDRDHSQDRETGGDA